MRRTVLAVGLAVGIGACHRAPPPEVAAQPAVDSSAVMRARQDSIARAEAEAQARAMAERHRADSLAALQRASDDLKAALATMIHFDFDQAVIRPLDEQLLDQKVSILGANAGARLLIAGNCDERGSEEYNLALGNRRAVGAKQYLVRHGINGSRIETVSYGKERPLDASHDEEAWAENRNDQFGLLTTNGLLRQP